MQIRSAFLCRLSDAAGEYSAEAARMKMHLKQQQKRILIKFLPPPHCHLLRNQLQTLSRRQYLMTTTASATMQRRESERWAVAVGMQ